MSTGYSSIAIDVEPDPQHLRFNEAIEKIDGRGDDAARDHQRAQTIGRSVRAAVQRVRRVQGWPTRSSTQAEKVTNRRKAFIYISSGYDFNPFTDSRYKALQDHVRSTAGRRCVDRDGQRRRRSADEPGDCAGDAACSETRSSRTACSSRKRI